MAGTAEMGGGRYSVDGGVANDFISEIKLE